MGAVQREMPLKVLPSGPPNSLYSPTKKQFADDAPVRWSLVSNYTGARLERSGKLRSHSSQRKPPPGQPQNN